MYREPETFLIFSILDSHYSLRTRDIQEIMQETKVHDLPFVPDYIEGLVNCRGKPYTAVNFALMKKEADTRPIAQQTYLVFKREDEQLCIHISNIDLFYEAEEDDVTERGVKYKNREIPFFDTNSVIAKLRKDLGYE